MKIIKVKKSDASGAFSDSKKMFALCNRGIGDALTAMYRIQLNASKLESGHESEELMDHMDDVQEQFEKLAKSIANAQKAIENAG